MLRERHGGMSKELKEYFNEQQKICKALRAALQERAAHRPAARAASAASPSPTVMWHLMAMRRYGEVLDGPEQDGYLLYTPPGA